MAVLAGNVNGLAMAIATDACLPAVQRVAGARLEARGQALTVVIAERAEERPSNAGGVHRPASVIELLAEIRIHAPDHVGRHGHTQTLGRGRVLPGEIAGRVSLAGCPTVDFPQIFVDLIHGRSGLSHRRGGLGNAAGGFRARHLRGHERKRAVRGQCDEFPQCCLRRRHVRDRIEKGLRLDHLRHRHFDMQR